MPEKKFKVAQYPKGHPERVVVNPPNPAPAPVVEPQAEQQGEPEPEPES